MSDGHEVRAAFARNARSVFAKSTTVLGIRMAQSCHSRVML